MEGSKQSSFKQEIVSEESGWTMYFDDFLAAQNRNSGCDFPSGFEGSSMVSDAASGVAWKLSNSIKLSVAKSSPPSLSFKKRRTRGVLEDDPLEDTASSPVNSPKVSGVIQLEIDPKNKNEILGNSQEKEDTMEFQKQDRDELGFAETEEQCGVLKKRGLCLIPLSMIEKYLG